MIQKFKTARYLLLTDEELDGVIDGSISSDTLCFSKGHLSMALEIKESRNYYGKLGCEWLKGPGCGVAGCGVCRDEG